MDLALDTEQLMKEPKLKLYTGARATHLGSSPSSDTH